MGKLIIGLVIGLIVGGLLIFFLFVGVPRATQTPGAPIQAPDNSQAGQAVQIALKQEFFNGILTTIFRDMSSPSFPLGADGRAANQGTCDGRITVLREGSGVQTSLRFENNRIAAPLAFSGSYNSPFGCIQFTGWAQANLELRYDAVAQAVFGRINVETVNLDGVNPIVGGFLTPLVQTTLNNRVNPVQILDGKQIAIDVPVASTGGRLKANVTDVRAEFKDDALNLYVVYSFTGVPVQ